MHTYVYAFIYVYMSICMYVRIVLYGVLIVICRLLICLFHFNYFHIHREKLLFSYFRNRNVPLADLKCQLLLSTQTVK